MSLFRRIKYFIEERKFAILYTLIYILGAIITIKYALMVNIDVGEAILGYALTTLAGWLFPFAGMGIILLFIILVTMPEELVALYFATFFIIASISTYYAMKKYFW